MPLLPGAFVVGEERQRHHAGIVHQNVDGPEGRDRTCGRGLELRHIGDIGHLGDALAACGGDAGDGLVEIVGVDVDADHRGAAGRALLRDEPAESATGAGDDDDFVGQVLRHGVPLLKTRAAPVSAPAPSA